MRLAIGIASAVYYGNALQHIESTKQLLSFITVNMWNALQHIESTKQLL